MVFFGYCNGEKTWMATSSSHISGYKICKEISFDFGLNDCEKVPFVLILCKVCSFVVKMTSNSFVCM